MGEAGRNVVLRYKEYIKFIRKTPLQIPVMHTILKTTSTDDTLTILHTLHTTNRQMGRTIDILLERVE